MRPATSLIGASSGSARRSVSTVSYATAAVPLSSTARVSGSSAAMCRYVNRICPSRSRRYSDSIGSLTLSSSSARSQTSSAAPSCAPTAAYCSSASWLPIPAPVSTSTSCPRCTSSRAPAGVSATRYSSGLISFATPTRMGAGDPTGGRLGAVALLELLAAAAPARVVAADVVVLALVNGGRRAAAAARERGRRARRRAGDRIGARERLVLVREVAVRRPAVRRRRLLGERFGVARLDLRVEEDRHDLLPDRRVQILEHVEALVPVLRQRVLLRHRAQVDPLAQVLHVLEVLAPALVDDLQD